MEHRTLKVKRRDLPHSTRSGAAIVEFAIVLPIVLFCFATMIEISRIMLLQHSADTAAYEGARCAMVPGATSEEAIGSADRLLKSAGLKNCKIKVAPEVIEEDTELILVQVEVPVSSNAWITPFWFMPNSIVSQVALVCERPAAVKLTAIPKLIAIDNALKNGAGTDEILAIVGNTTAVLLNVVSTTTSSLLDSATSLVSPVSQPINSTSGKFIVPNL